MQWEKPDGIQHMSHVILKIQFGDRGLIIIRELVIR